MLDEADTPEVRTKAKKVREWIAEAERTRQAREKNEESPRQGEGGAEGGKAEEKVRDCL